MVHVHSVLQQYERLGHGHTEHTSNEIDPPKQSTVDVRDRHLSAFTPLLFASRSAVSAATSQVEYKERSLMTGNYLIRFLFSINIAPWSPKAAKLEPPSAAGQEQRQKPMRQARGYLRRCRSSWLLVVSVVGVEKVAACVLAAMPTTCRSS